MFRYSAYRFQLYDIDLSFLQKNGYKVFSLVHVAKI